MEISETCCGPTNGVLPLMDTDATNPGPIDPSVLYDQDNHVSSAIWEGQERGVLRCHEHTSKLGEWRLTQKQIELVEKAGFGYLRLLPSISLDNPLISALVERWRKETNTFHLTVGEMTITLKDVALLLGLPIDGLPVLGITYTSCKSVCERYLGRVPEAGYKSGGMVKLSWLKEYFSQCPEDAPLEEVEHYTRAYLLYLVGSTIFSTTTGNKVPVMYLPLFEDFEKAGKYAWGAAALAFLYRSLGKASLKSQSTISGCLTLLQCWSYFHLNIGRPKFYQEPLHDCFPFVLRWKGKQSASTVKRDLIFYRKALDLLEPYDVEWLPYQNLNGTLLPESVRNSLILGRSQTMLICFDKAERHLPDRCLRQQNMLQGIPEDVQQWERKSRGVDSGIDLSEKMVSELNEWSARRLHILQGGSGVDESEYMYWYLRITRKFVGRPVSPLPHIQRTIKFRTKKKRMNAGLRDIAHIADTFLINGLDAQQIESISRIRAIAHNCLGDQVEIACLPSTSSQTYQGKRIREKERVRRNTNEKHNRDALNQLQTIGEGDEAEGYVGSGNMQLCHSKVESNEPVIHQPHANLGKRVRRKEREKMKTNQKRRWKDSSVQCDADSDELLSEFCNATIKDDLILSSHTDCKDNQLFYAAPEGEIAQTYDANIRVEGDEDGKGNLFYIAAENKSTESSHEASESKKSEACYAAAQIEKTGSYDAASQSEKPETCHSAGECEKTECSVVLKMVESHHAAHEGGKSEASHPVQNLDDSKLSLRTHEVDDLKIPPGFGECGAQTAKTAVEVFQQTSLQTVLSVAQQIDVVVEGNAKES
ncbi:hypothetical protein K2173_023219 [Erythroxylum novogranatense]|uniref:Aminotransferase-like plant mobile domain-containing protein n=1 Tax=Erythroxylum novogranatense TaxID=1862640 RepID=A0AAV8T9L5_9ROSI|nr:hypothetical protein K2173_023219 [Erythroxylum novogranatense]